MKSIKPTGGTFNWPHQTALDGDGTYWVADTYNNRVLHLGLDGSVLANWNHGGAITLPRGIATDGTYVYVDNGGPSTVEKYTKAGVFQKVVASKGTAAGQVSLPWNLALQGSNLYIADGNNGRVVVVTTTGTAVTTFGTAGTGAAQLSTPRSVAIDPTSGTIAVADFGNNRISLWK